MRKQVRRIVVWCFLGTILFAIAVVLTVLIRMGMYSGSAFLVHSVPLAIVAVWRDPILIVAFVFAAIGLWVFPWEWFGNDDEEEKSGVIRGRELASLQVARKRVDAKLRARRAELRVDRQGR